MSLPIETMKKITQFKVLNSILLISQLMRKSGLYFTAVHYLTSNQMRSEDLPAMMAQMFRSVLLHSDIPSLSTFPIEAFPKSHKSVD